MPNRRTPPGAVEAKSGISIGTPNVTSLGTGIRLVIGDVTGLIPAIGNIGKPDGILLIGVGVGNRVTAGFG